MNKQPLAWSWSRLSTFEQCPRKFYLQNISKELKYVQSPQAKRGEKMHKLLEICAKQIMEHGHCSAQTANLNYVDIEQVIPLLKKLIAGADEVLIEEGSNEKEKYGINAEFKKVSYFDKKVWFRFAIDFARKFGNKAVIADWKTGNNYGYNDQLKMMAAIIMEIIWPDVDEVKACYIYLDKGESSCRVFKRAELDDMWDDLIDRAGAIERAREKNEWPCKKNNFCNWCDANPNQCELK